MALNKEKIKKNIVDHLFWDARVDASSITVQMNDGTVVLSGTTSTYLARKAAEQDTWAVPGVNAVRNEILVSFPYGHLIPSDDEIKGTVANILSWDPNIDDSDIIISTENGNVTIDGSVPAFWQKVRAEEHVGEVNGVKAVHSRLTVVPQKHYVDELIARDIAAALDRNTITDVDKIEVVVDNGHVVLSGNVSGFNASKSAENIAKNTDGVVDVKNDLVVI